VVKVLQNLFEVELDKENFTSNDVYEHARKMYDSPPPRDDISLGLFVVAEFANVLKLCGFDATRTELTTLQGGWQALFTGFDLSSQNEMPGAPFLRFLQGRERHCQRNFSRTQ
jgi:hypothetical protein